MAPLRIWANAINQLYQARAISPAVGASLARTLETGGSRGVREDWSECRSDEWMVENMIMFYDEVSERLASLGILTADEVVAQQALLRALTPTALPAVWGIHRVSCIA